MDLLRYNCTSGSRVDLIAPSAGDIHSSRVERESDGAHPDTVSTRIREFYDVNLWGFSEVLSRTWARKFNTAAGDGEPGDFEPILGRTGDTDKLLILYDRSQFEELDNFEIGWEERPWYKSTLKPRSALVAKLQHKRTSHHFYFYGESSLPGNGCRPPKTGSSEIPR